MGTLARSGAVIVLVAVVIKQSPAVPDVLTSYELNLLYLAVGFVALGVYTYRNGGLSRGETTSREDGLSIGGVPTSLLKLLGAAIATFWFLLVLATLDGPGFPAENRAVSFVGIFLLVLVYPGFHHDAGKLVRRNWPYLLAFVTLWGVYLGHGFNGAPGSTLAAFPVAVGFLLVVNLFVIPRYVSVAEFCWAVSRVSAVVVLLGVGAYVVGEYTAIFLPVEHWEGTFSPPFLSIRINRMQSVFGNPNSMGLLAFVGTVAALAELGRIRHEAGSALPFVVPGVLVVVNGLGVYLSHSRASMLAAGIATVIYLAAKTSGREVLPAAIVVTLGLLTVALVSVASGLLAVDPSGRFVLWSGGVQAIVREPTLVGEGIVGTGELIAPYVDDPDYSGSGVHNSYLTTTIRAGVLGGAAHVILAIGSFTHASIRKRGSNVAAVALAVGFAVHQLFESYTLFHHSMGAILASIAVGYVIIATPTSKERSAEMADRSIAEAFSGESRTVRK